MVTGSSAVDEGEVEDEVEGEVEVEVEVEEGDEVRGVLLGCEVGRDKFGHSY